MKVGVLALQGDFDAHRTRLAELGANTLPVRTAAQVYAVSGLVFPGGESTAMLKLMTAELKAAIISATASGVPVLATCAGVILLADEVSSPAQESLKLLNVAVQRNAYGRQVDSFIDEKLNWTTEGKQLVSRVLASPNDGIEGVFIRAPKIIKTGANVSVLIARGEEPVLVKQDNIIAATFHPELSSSAQIVHQLFLSLMSSSSNQTRRVI